MFRLHEARFSVSPSRDGVTLRVRFTMPGPPLPGVTAVPEPSSVLALIIVGAMCSRRRGRD